MTGSYRPEALADLLDGLSFTETSQSYILTCPKCNKAKKLYIRKHDGRFVCWHCKGDGFEGRPEFALRELLPLSFKEIQERLYGIAQVQGSSLMALEFKDTESTPRQIQEPLEIVAYPLDFHPIGSYRSIPGLRYLESRGISLELAQKYDLAYSTIQRRVIFPVSHQGKLYGWQGRTIDKDSWTDPVTMRKRSIPKALTSLGFKKEQALFAWDRLDGSPHAVITEGPADCIACDPLGGNVAAFGKAVSERQLQIIKDSGVKKIYLGLDPDAVVETQRLAQALHDYEVYELLPGPGFKDLGEMCAHPEGVIEQFNRAPRIKPGTMRRFFKATKFA
jgi:DNA primase